MNSKKFYIALCVMPVLALAVRSFNSPSAPTPLIDATGTESADRHPSSTAEASAVSLASSLNGAASPEPLRKSAHEVIDIKANEATQDDYFNDRLAKAQKIFPKTPTGEALAVIAAYSEMGSIFRTPEGAKLADAIEFMKAHPEQSLTDLDNSFDLITDEFDSSRSFLLQQVARFETDPRSRIEILQKDFARYREKVPADKASAFGPTITYEALLEVTSDPELIAKEVRELMKVYGKSSAGKALWLRFSDRFPNEARAL